MINRIQDICGELNLKGARIIPWFSHEGCRIENIFGEKLTEFMPLEETIQWLNRQEGILNLKQKKSLTIKIERVSSKH